MPHVAVTMTYLAFVFHHHITFLYSYFLHRHFIVTPLLILFNFIRDCLQVKYMVRRK